MGARRVLFHPKVKSEDLPKLDPAVRHRVRVAIETKLAVHPEAHAKPLGYTLAGLWCLRVGDWRVIFALRPEEVWVLRVGHRREVCNEPGNREPRDQTGG
ncbi:MAG: type II toxin-antitoxin system RelE family toxin [Thermoanaerobaculum sp.]